MLLFVVYQLFVVPAKVDAAQETLAQELVRDWKQQPTVPNPNHWEGADPGNGQPLVRMSIPRLELNWVVVEGVTLPDLRRGPGHYPGTQYPGQVGNFAVAGHRAPRMFWDLDQVAVGDPILVQANTTVFTYTVTTTEIVSPDAVGVIAPVPDHPDEPAAKRFLTLTTCNPKWASYERLVVHAALTDVRTVPAGSLIA
jgi:sortase A